MHLYGTAKSVKQLRGEPANGGHSSHVVLAHILVKQKLEVGSQKRCPI
jgi:hypothetical protein